MCPPSPHHHADTRITARPSLALILRMLLVTCALLLAWAEFQPSLGDTRSDIGRPSAQHPVPWRDTAS